MKITLIRLSRQWRHVHVRKAMIEQAMRDIDGEVAVALSTDAHVRRLNHQFRAKDKPTNVLSFPNETHTGGDVILAIETLRREAKAEAKPLRDHLEHLIVHGILHTVGFDHETESDWQAMCDMEVKICASLGFEPY